MDDSNSNDRLNRIEQLTLQLTESSLRSDKRLYALTEASILSDKRLDALIGAVSQIAAAASLTDKRLSAFIDQVAQSQRESKVRIAALEDSMHALIAVVDSIIRKPPQP